MRLLLLAVLLANLTFLAYAQFAAESATRIQPSHLEVSPEKIRVLKASGKSEPDRVQAGPLNAAPPAAVTAVAAACIEWGVFAGPVVARADTALARLALPADKVDRTIVDSPGYWVYLPPPKSKPETDRKMGELKALGVSDFFIVQDAGPWRNAISLGVFRAEEAARDYLARLKARGVNSALMVRRENLGKQVVFLVREPDEAMVGRLAALQQEFPASELKAIRCPAAPAAKG